jgi:hypothetical protein
MVPCVPHPSLAPCALQLDHWFKTQTLLLQQVQDLLRRRIFSAPSPPLSPSVPSATQDPSRPQAPIAPQQTDPPTPPPPLRPSPSALGPSVPPTPSEPLRTPDFGFPSDFGLRISDFIHLTLPTLQTLPTLLTLKPLLDWGKLLLKQAQLVLACQKLQNKTAHPGEPQATDTQDGPPHNSQAIALMRKTFFADVDEYEHSGRLKIPPVPAPVLGDTHGLCYRHAR